MNKEHRFEVLPESNAGNQRKYFYGVTVKSSIREMHMEYILINHIDNIFTIGQCCEYIVKTGVDECFIFKSLHQEARYPVVFFWSFLMRFR